MIEYVIGDATEPIGDDKRIIIHCCNDKGAWGAGFVLALSRKWKEPEQEYRNWSKTKNMFKLGMIQYVNVDAGIAVVNMIGQHGVGFVGNVPPVRYDAIAECLEKVAGIAIKQNASIHAPRFGSALAGGKWEIIEKQIEDIICSKNINVTIYDLP